MFISRYSKLTEIGLKLSPVMRWLMTSALFFCILVVWYMSVFYPLSCNMQKAAEDRAVLLGEQSVLATVQDKVEKLQALVAAEKQVWNTKARHSAQEAGRDSLFALIDLFGKLGISIESYHPQGTIDRNWYIKQSVQIQCTATWEQLLALCQSLQKQVVPYHAQHIRIERRENEQLHVVMTLSQKIPKEIS